MLHFSSVSSLFFLPLLFLGFRDTEQIPKRVEFEGLLNKITTTQTSCQVSVYISLSRQRLHDIFSLGSEPFGKGREKKYPACCCSWKPSSFHKHNITKSSEEIALGPVLGPSDIYSRRSEQIHAPIKSTYDYISDISEWNTWVHSVYKNVKFYGCSLGKNNVGERTYQKIYVQHMLAQELDVLRKLDSPRCVVLGFSEMINACLPVLSNAFADSVTNSDRITKIRDLNRLSNCSQVPVDSKNQPGDQSQTSTNQSLRDESILTAMSSIHVSRSKYFLNAKEDFKVLFEDLKVDEPNHPVADETLKAFETLPAEVFLDWEAIIMSVSKK